MKRKDREEGDTSVSTATPTASSSIEFSSFDIDTFLRTESNVHQQQAEIDRVLEILSSAGQTNAALDILAVPLVVFTSAQLPEPSGLKGLWRRKSLLVHPDKCKLPHAPKVFEALKKAMVDLEDDNIRANMTAMLRDARDECYARNKIKYDDPGLNVAEKLTRDSQLAEKSPALIREIQLKLLELQRESIRRATVRLANEKGRDETQLIKSARQSQDKKAHDKAWEATRENRMNNWQSFLKKKGGHSKGGGGIAKRGSSSASK